MVSIVIPTYNRANLVGQTIDSILAQTYQDFEVIVVDDGSSDNTRDVIAAFTDERVKYVYQRNQERSAARNNGASVAQGEYLFFVDSDDLIYPWALERLVVAIEAAADNVLAYGGHTRVDEHNRYVYPSDWWPYKEPLDGNSDPSARILKGNCFVLATLVKTSAFNRAGGFDVSLKYAEDWDLWIRVSCLGKFACVAEPCSAIRVHGGNSMGDLQGLLNGELHVIETHWGPDQGKRDAERMQVEASVYARAGIAGIAVGSSGALEWLQRAKTIADELGYGQALPDQLTNTMQRTVGIRHRMRAVAATRLEESLRRLGYDRQTVKRQGLAYWLALFYYDSNAGYYWSAMGDVCEMLRGGYMLHLNRGHWVSMMRVLAKAVCSGRQRLQYFPRLATGA